MKSLRFQLLLLLLGLALGYFGGALVRNLPSSADALDEKAPAVQSAASPRDSSRAHWRERFLAILQVPSASLRMASFYAFATEVPPEQMPQALEAIHPEGWARHHGDLPLALSMEWIRHGGNGLPASFASLYRRHPELADNFSGVAFNLGLHNAPEAVPVLQSFSQPELQSLLANSFIDGLRQGHPEALFPARLALLGPSQAFASLDDSELEPALAAFWQGPSHYLDAGAYPPPRFWFELGKRHGKACIEKIPTNYQRNDILLGMLLSPRSLSEEQVKAVAKNWSPNASQYEFIDEADARSLIELLARHPETAPKLSQRGMGHLWSKGLDRSLSESLLSQAQLDSALRATLLRHAASLYPPEELVLKLVDLPAFARNQALASMTRELPEGEHALLIESLPDSWLSPQVASQSLNALVAQEDRDGLRLLAQKTGSLGRYLPEQADVAAKLWELDPERYLQGIASLPFHEQTRQLGIVAAIADAEELPALLEATTLEKQTDVLIGLVREKPDVALAILGSARDSPFTAEQAVAFGSQVAFSAPTEHVRSYFQSQALDTGSEQLAFLSYSLNELPLDETGYLARELAQTSPMHDYLHRFAQEIGSEQIDPAGLERLHAERPERFLPLLASTLANEYRPHLEAKAKTLLASPALDRSQRLALHQALYSRQTP